jgi:hypothetical protein
MPARRVVAGLILLLGVLLAVQGTVALATGPEILAQVPPTPTPFRFLTPTPFVPSKTTTTTTTTVPGQTMPRAGGFPLELALPVLAGGIAAIGGGSLLLRRKNRG